MSEHQTKSCDLSEYDDMSTDELEEILYQDSLIKGDEGYDMETVLYITKILMHRQQIALLDDPSDPEAAWEDFRENYLPAVRLRLKGHDAKKALMERRWNIKFRIGSAVAVLAALVIGIGYGARANGINLWELFNGLTKDAFTTTAVKDIPVEIRDILNEYGIFEDLVPRWMPDGYEYVNSKVVEKLTSTEFLFTYTDEISDISVSIKDINGTITTSYERNDTSIEIYSQNSLDYYIINNYGITTIEWINGDHECSIFGHFSTEDAKKMIDSIRGG